LRPLENLYYAIGEIAYAVAGADGDIQKSERQKFHNLVNNELEHGNSGYDISSIIFQAMDKDKRAPRDVYDETMRNIRQNSHYLSPEMKTSFKKVVKKMTMAFPKVSPKGAELAARFTKEIEAIHGDPIYYSQHQ